MENINLEDYQVADYDDQCKKNPCIICGKEVKESNPYWVHMTTAGVLVPTSVNENEVSDSQGLFPIGSNCMRKLPSQYVIKSC